MLDEAPHIMHYYPLAGDVKDYGFSSNLYNGTLVNTPVQSTDRFSNANKAYQVGDASYASTKRIETSDSDEFSFGNGTTDVACTLCLWAKCENTISGSYWAMHKDGGTAQREYVVVPYTSSFSAGYFTTFRDASAAVLMGGNETSAGMTTGVWNHFAVTYNGVGGSTAGNFVRHLINGIYRSGYTAFNDASYVAMENLAQPLSFGRADSVQGPVSLNKAVIIKGVQLADWEINMLSKQV